MSRLPDRRNRIESRRRRQTTDSFEGPAERRAGRSRGDGVGVRARLCANRRFVPLRQEEGCGRHERPRSAGRCRARRREGAGLASAPRVVGPLPGGPNPRQRSTLLLSHLAADNRTRSDLRGRIGLLLFQRPSEARHRESRLWSRSESYVGVLRTRSTPLGAHCRRGNRLPRATRAGSLLIAAVNAGGRVAAAETARGVEAALREEGIERHFLVQFDELE